MLKGVARKRGFMQPYISKYLKEAVIVIFHPQMFWICIPNFNKFYFLSLQRFISYFKYLFFSSYLFAFDLSIILTYRSNITH